jgi:hypothetical protein
LFVGDLTTGLAGWIKSDQLTIDNGDTWKNTENSGDMLRGSLLHVLQASSKKRDVIQDRVQVSLYFMIVVVCFNMFKLVILSHVLVTDRPAYLVTLGDAASSFLKQNDPHTKGKCVQGRD